MRIAKSRNIAHKYVAMLAFLYQNHLRLARYINKTMTRALERRARYRITVTTMRSPIRAIKHDLNPLANMHPFANDPPPPPT